MTALGFMGCIHLGVMIAAAIIGLCVLSDEPKKASQAILTAPLWEVWLFVWLYKGIAWLVFEADFRNKHS